MFSHLELSFDLAEGKVTTETAAKDASGEPYHKHVLDLATDSSISLTGSEVTHYKPAGETLAPVATAAPAPVAQVVQQPVQQPVQVVAPAPTPAPEAYDWTNPNEWKKFLKPDELAAVNAREAAEWQTANGAVANQWQTHTTDNVNISEEWKKYLNPADNSYDYSGYGFAEAGLEGENDMKVLSIEEQREVAFKVVFFFIGLIAASFGVLYVYHRMTQANIKSVREKQTL